MPEPWNNWYHCNGNTYATWLPGDPRGFRERHHLRHVEGDYKKPPPPGIYEGLHQWTRRQLLAKPVHLSLEQRQTAVRALAWRLLEDGVQPIALAMDDHHFHFLLRCDDRRPRHWIGRAKKCASLALRRGGWEGPLWAKSCRCLPIGDRAHQLRAFDYIVRHRDKDAVVWTFRDARPAGPYEKDDGAARSGVEPHGKPGR